MPIQLVTIEGNIGAGKTTIAKQMANFMPDTCFMAAPTRESNPHWKHFQSEPAKHALDMQIWFLRERLRVYVAAIEHMQRVQESVLLDFSIWSDVIFAQIHFQEGYMTADELARYDELWRAILALELPPPHLSILLQANPQVCLERIETSGSRSGHNMPTPDHLLHLDTLFAQRWLRDLEWVYTPQRWLSTKRVPLSAPGLPPAPSNLILARDWNLLTSIKPTAVADAVYCTEPTDFAEWIAPFRASDAASILRDGAAVAVS